MARAALIWLLICSCLTAADISVTLPPGAACFRCYEIAITLPAEWLPPAAQLHDAYDADRNQQFLRLQLDMQHADASLSLPVFCLRNKPQGPWLLQARWTPTRTGVWSAVLRGSLHNGKQLRVIEHKLTQTVTVSDDTLPGLLQYPSIDSSQRYFHVSNSDGSSRARLFHGVCRAWLVTATRDASGWAAHEYASRQQELLPAMRTHGYDMLHLWMAPWEFQLVHLDQAEFWRQADDRWQRHQLTDTTAPAWQRYDQGRAAALDQLMQQLSGNQQTQRIYTLLAPMPHVSLQLKSHPWGSEGCWSQADDPGQALQKCNGFSALLGERAFWSFFHADPQAKLDSWESRCFDHQANYFRYVIARWGASPSLGIWELFDEIDAIGDGIGLLQQRSGWWSDPRHQQWLQNICALFNGRLQRRDGLRYAGDAYQHPLHCATTSHAGGFSATGNMHWRTLPDQRLSPGWHWYPMPGDPDLLTYWAKTVHGVSAFSQVWKNQRPYFLGEFGYIDRLHPQDDVNILYPSLLHFGIWASAFNGQAITVMDWDDGKEYGELRPRDSGAGGPFGKDAYPIHNGKRLEVLRAFIRDIDWQTVHISNQDPQTPHITEKNPQRSFLICESQRIHGWALFFDQHYQSVIHDIADGKWRLQYVDPWTGKALAPAQDLTVTNNTLQLNSKGITEKLVEQRSQFSATQRLCRGFDIAWRLWKVDSELQAGDKQ